MSQVPSSRLRSRLRSRLTSRRAWWSRWGVALALAGAAVGCAPPEEGDAPVVEARAGELVTTIRVAGHVGAGRVGIAGVSVALNGAQQKTAITDANGNFKFDVPAGSYSLGFTKSGASFNPSVLNLNGLTASTFQSVSCVAGCAAPASIVPSRELVITDAGVVNDPRSDSATTGPWSFRFLMKQMAPAGADENWFTLGWLDQIRNSHTINGFPVDARETSPLGFTVNQGGQLNWGSQFKLVAIVNRTDLHGSGPGELRLVYGAGSTLTVIFEYGLPATRDRKDWAQQFHQLASLTPGTAAYNTALQAITDQVVRANTSPSKPNGSSINQVRMNEILLANTASPNWQLREFHLQPNGILLLSQTAGTPDDSADLVTSPLNAQLASFINGNVVDLLGGFATVPSSMLGGQASEDFAKQSTLWGNFTTTVNEPARHAFAGATCNGCHFSEVNRNLPAGVTNPQNVQIFYQISPSGALSPLVTEVEIPRRAIFAQHLLSCSGTGCAAGAEPMLP